MRKMLIALAVAAGFTGTPALLAQHAMGDTTRAGHHMMMMQHHSVAAVDLLLAHRDSLKLTDDQVSKLGELREHFARSNGHAMHGMQGMKMGEGGAMGQGMRMEQGQGQGMNAGMAAQGMNMAPRPPHIAFDRVPGKSVPRVHRAPVPEHCPMCPMAALTPDQRRQAHQLLNHGQHD